MRLSAACTLCYLPHPFSLTACQLSVYGRPFIQTRILLCFLTLLYDMSLLAPARGLAIGILERFPPLQELGIGMLLAAPKKKTSHMKKRQRLLANNAHRNNSKYMNNLNRCPSCGNYKRMNTLCAFCVGEIQHLWKSHLRDLEAKDQKQNILDELSDVDKRVLYPGKKDTAYIEKLKDKGSYLKRKTRTLPVER